MVLFQVLPLYASGNEVQNAVIEISPLGEEETSNATTYSVLDDGALYAMQNAKSNKWASTATTASTANTHNLFQYSAWPSVAQNFRFVKTGDGDNIYFIYPLEYGNQNSNQDRALYYDSSAISNTNSSGTNVYPNEYSVLNANSFKWVIQQESDGYFTIHAYANPTYVLTAIGTATGSVENTGIDQGGNIGLKKLVSSTSSLFSYQKWDLNFIVPNGTYYLHNCASDFYLGGNSSYLLDPITQELQLTNLQSWTFQYIGNGKYFINSAYNYALCVDSSTPTENALVHTQSNMAQPRFQWYIERLDDKSFQIRSVSAADSGYNYVLCGGSSSYSDYVRIASPSETSMADNWFIHDGLNGKYANIFLGKEPGDTAMPGLVNQVNNAFGSQMSLPGFGYTSIAKNEYLTLLDSVEIFAHITHGSPDYINVYSGEYLAYDTYIDDRFDEDDLSNIKVVVLASCYSSSSHQNNPSLAHSIASKGAQNVIGFHDSINIPVTNDWVVAFLSALSQGLSVEAAIDAADEIFLRDGEITSNEQAFINCRMVYESSYDSSSVVPCP